MGREHFVEFGAERRHVPTNLVEVSRAFPAGESDGDVEEVFLAAAAENDGWIRHCALSTKQPANPCERPRPSARTQLCPAEQTNFNRDSNSGRERETRSESADGSPWQNRLASFHQV